MSYAEQNPYDAGGAFAPIAATAAESERAAFIRKTYVHLAGAVAALVAIEAVIFQAVPADQLARISIWAFSGYNWLIVIGAFMLVSFVADKWANSSTNLSMQYAGLGLYVMAQAFILLPMLLMATRIDPLIVRQAGLMTGIVFGGLTGLVMFTKADFSWLGKYLGIAVMVAIGLILCSVFFGTGLGTWFSGAMIAVASGYIVYYTSNILHHYRTDQHVAAALALFASVALLFWYILQLFMFSRD